MFFKCKMCGGNLEFESDATVGVCDSCGTKQTLPKIDSERRANLYDRANHFRRNNEFDKASGLYEQILAEDTTDAEAYWSLVLCRYGIEYVEDPATHKRIPTVNRAQYTSVYDDENYKSALQYADRFQKDLYEEEANCINEIQKGILEISQKEEPFDVFICYKETDNNGRRTPDSVLATDLYHQLTKEGYHVFFSRITLEDKIGTVYEPYIFAALNSAKVMVVLGTKAEYFNSVWVKNEWSRYLSLVKESDGKKVLIPAYRDMDPYDLPEEFSHLQAQDMSKLGFMQDLVRGIQKIVRKEEEKKTVIEKETVAAGNVNVASLLKRVTLFLEDGSFSDANTYCERVLDQDPENAEAYLGKLMVERRVNKTEDLLQCSDPLDKSNNFSKILRFGNNELTSTLQEYNALIKERNEQERIKTVYQNAVAGMQAADSETAYLEVAKEFSSIIGYMDSAELEQSCLQAATSCKKEEEERIKREAEERRKQAIEQENKKVNTLYTALNSVNNIQGAEGIRAQLLSCALVVNADEVNKRVDERINIIKREEERRKQEEKRKRNKTKKICIIAIIVFVISAILIFVICKSVLEKKKDRAKRQFDSFVSEGNYAQAEQIIETNIRKGSDLYYESYLRLGKEMIKKYGLQISADDLSKAKSYFKKCNNSPYSNRYASYCDAVSDIISGKEFDTIKVIELLVDSGDVGDDVIAMIRSDTSKYSGRVYKSWSIPYGQDGFEYRYEIDDDGIVVKQTTRIKNYKVDVDWTYKSYNLKYVDGKFNLSTVDGYNYDEERDALTNSSGDIECKRSKK